MQVHKCSTTFKLPYRLQFNSNFKILFCKDPIEIANQKIKQSFKYSVHSFHETAGWN